MCKPHYGNQDFSPLTTGIYFIVIMKKTPLHNGNSPLRTKMGVAVLMPLNSAVSWRKHVAWYVSIKPNESDIKQI